MYKTTDSVTAPVSNNTQVNSNPYSGSSVFQQLREEMARISQETDNDDAAARAAQRQLLSGLLRATEMLNRALYKASGWNALMAAYSRFSGLIVESSNATAADLRRAVRQMTALMGRLETYGPGDEASSELKQNLPVSQAVLGAGSSAPAGSVEAALMNMLV